MKILFISNGVYEYDGRLRELIKISKGIGQTTFITRVNSSDIKQQDNSHITINRNKIFNYLELIIKTLLVAVNMKKVDVLFIDNRKAVIPGLIINWLKRPKIIIQDVRELYLINEVQHMSGKIGCIFEKSLINKANILICANSYRAEIMKSYYSLDNVPLTYENIRKLEFDNEIEIDELKLKHEKIINRDKFKIISTSGVDISRTNDKLIIAMKELGENFELLLVGGGSKKDRNKIDDLIKRYKLNNVHLISKVGENELKYLIQQCQIGVVNYNNKDTNNKLCASGKIYEFIFEGIPVITTENIPLEGLTKRYNIGVSDNNYVDGILKIYKDYSFYKKNVEIFSRSIDVENNNEHLIEKIKEYLVTFSK